MRDAAVLIAGGVDAAGKRAILGVSVALSEQEVHWRTFLQSLVDRGLRGVQLLISDAHSGLKAARLAVFGGVPWQRCHGTPPKTANRAAFTPPCASLISNCTPRSPRSTKLCRNVRQCTSCSDSATETPSTARLPAASTPLAINTAASRTWPFCRTFS